MAAVDIDLVPVNTNYVITVGTIFLPNKMERVKCRHSTLTVDNEVARKNGFDTIRLVVEKVTI